MNHSFTKSLMIVLTLLALMGSTLGLAPAYALTGGPDAFGYVFLDSAESGGPVYNFEDISGTGTPVALGDDQMSGAIPIGFAFNYYGSSYSNAYISSNGFLSLLPGQPHGCCSGPTLPTAGTPNGVIAGWWTDLYPPGGGSIRYRTLGTAPARRFIVQYTNIRYYGSTATVTFQIKLFEGNDRIEVHYANIQANSNTHSAGIENATGSTGLTYYRGTSPLTTPRAVRYEYSASGNYCTPSTSSPYYMGIQRVEFGTINNYSGTTNNTYTDYTASYSTAVVPGASYGIRVYGWGYYQNWRVWIDWNQDLDFNDAGETYNLSRTGYNGSGTISVPAGALGGTTTMRVRGEYYYYGYPPSCGNVYYGEAEDYGITVSGGGDTTPPIVTSFTATSPSSSLNIPITAFIASDAVGVTGYMITTSSSQPSAGAAGWTGTPPTTYPVAADGTYTLYPWAKDAAGNVSAVFATPRTVVVDTTPPGTTITATPPDPSNSSDATFSFTGSDPGGSGVAGFQCRLDTGSWAGCTSPRSYTGLSDGQHTFQVRAIDNAGNVDPTPASYTWDIDTVAPTVSIGAPSVSLTNSGPVEYSITYGGADTVDLTVADITLNRTGTADGTVTVLNGSTSNPTVRISGISGDGTLGISLAAGTASDQAGNSAPAAGPSATVDVVNTITYSLGTSDPNLTEGDSGSQQVTFTISRSGATNVASSVEFDIDGTATYNSDYDNVGGTGGASGLSGTISFAADETSKTITLDVLGDQVDEADETIRVTLSNGTAPETVGYSGNPASTTIQDDDTAGITVSPTSLTIAEPSGNGVFTVSLTSEPTDPVTVNLIPSDLSECTVSPAPAVLNSSNWQAGVDVTVEARDDQISDGPQACDVITSQAVSDDNNYSGLNPDNVSVTVNDDEVKGLTVTQSNGSTDVTEGGATDSYTVRLNTIPTETVTINFNTGSQLEAITSLTFDPDSTALDPQTVTVTATDDATVEGDHTGTISHSASGGGYDSVSIAEVSANITDNDLAYAITADQATVAEGNSGSTTIGFTVQRSGAVTTTSGSVSFSLGGAATNGTDYNNVVPAAGSVIDFATGETQQQISLDVLGDWVAEPDEAVIVTLTNPTAPGSAAVTGNPASSTITNDDTPGFTFDPPSGLVTSEDGITDTFTIRLNTQPSGDVTISLSSLNPGEGTVSPTSVTFTNSDWNQPQTVTVTGVDDTPPVADGDVAYSIQTGAAVSSDNNYNNLDPADVSATNQDNDTPGFTVDPTSLSVNEPHGSATFTIRLNTQPTADVTIGLSSGDPGQCTVAPTSVTLNNTNWQTGVEVTVTAVDDGVEDGTQMCLVQTAAASSADNNYNGSDPDDVSVTVNEIRIYLPIIMNGFVSAPDLIIVPGTLRATSTGVSLTIQNVGTETVVDAFWIDVYFNPNQTPRLNKEWETIAQAGAVWGVTKSLAPDETLDLTTGGAFYVPDESSASFPASATVYGLVDSINFDTTYGAVKESDEGNNLSEPVSSAQGQGEAAVSGQGQPPALDRLPER
jgi:hypothetical protein